ncbi:MAG: HlyD family efflux transporter periplasmic adaptor subunit [Planctomycetia bacterium]|nr:HlyD family efflux transporter periplasmic adaptor subunit [Planctomycetia bacterium]
MGKSKIPERAFEATASPRAPQRPGNEPDDSFWAGIERMLADVAAQARAEPLPEDFPARVLGWLHDVLGTDEETFWHQDLNGRLRNWSNRQPLAPANGSSTGSNGAMAHDDQSGADDPQRLEFVKSVLATGSARTAVMDSSAPGQAPERTGASADHTRVACPIRCEGGTAAVLEVQHHRRAAADVQLALEVLRSVAELCSDYLRRYQLQEFARDRASRNELAQFSRRIHDSLDIGETAYAIANEGRRLVGCDRVAVVACRGSACETLAVSGAARWDRRSNSIARLEELCAAVAAGGDALSAGSLAADLPPQVRVPLDAYLETSQIRDLCVLPLTGTLGADGSPARPAGLLVLEQFTGVLTDEMRERGSTIAEPGAQALEHALVVQRIPWGRFFRRHDWRARLQGRGRTALAVAAGIAVLLAGACLIPADFEVEARGVLQPRLRRDVFAPDDGVVEELFVDHGMQVISGQPLVALRNAQLDLDLKRVWGELQAARKRLSAIETARVEATVGNAAGAVAAARLSGEDAELQELVAALSRQHTLLEAQQIELRVASPIAGQVLTWDLPQLLQGRPVHRGQALMTIADPTGPWDIELEVADRDAGHVLEARQNGQGAALKTSYRMATDPGVSHESSVDRVALSIERTAAGEPALRVVGGVDANVVSTARPGATVLAKIHCGRRSLAYVWLRDVYDAITTRLLF